MFRDDYKKELDSLVLTDDFKQQTVEMLNIRNSKAPPSSEKSIKFPRRPIRPVAAAIAAVALSAMVLLAAGSLSDRFITADNITEAETAPDITEEINQHNSTFDALPQQFSTDNRIYTIADADFGYEERKSAASRLNTDKILFNTETSGGMGFEGLMFYDISELNTKNSFTPEYTVTSLPVYKFAPLDKNSLKAEYIEIIESTGADENSVISVEYEWAQMGTHNGLPVIMDTVKTDSDTQPDGYTEIYNMSVEFENGYIEIFPSRGQISVYLYDGNAGSMDDYELGNYVAGSYTNILGNSLDSYVMNDYDIYGNQDYILTYMFRKSDSYGQSLFNNSAGSIATWQLDELIYAENDKGSCLHFLYTSPDCYTEAEELPAISRQQALAMLYSGDYISTVYEEIAESTAVSKIELVYKEPPSYTPGLMKKGYALPFYKFYVELPDYRRETETGVLKTYGIYYVCAIHPDYVEYTDGYAQFN